MIMSKKIYIAGAITNNPNYIEQFKAAEEQLKAKGYTVINPVKNEGFAYREYINMGLCELMHCDAIYLLKDYETSAGAMLEYEYAKTVGLEIIKEEVERILFSHDGYPYCPHCGNEFEAYPYGKIKRGYCYVCGKEVANE